MAGRLINKRTRWTNKTYQHKPLAIQKKETNKMEIQPEAVQNTEEATKTNEYIPVSDLCASLDTVVPSSMRYELHKAMQTVDRRVNDVDEYVARKLQYITGNATEEERKYGLTLLCDAFGAEQVDGIATAIYNIENREQGIIIGDQTGIGKGRQAAGIIRYAILNGYKPIFLTEKPNLFSDILRDLIAIGSDDGVILRYLESTEEVSRDTAEMDDNTDEEELVKSGEEFEGEEDDQTGIIGDFVRREVYRENKQYDKQKIGRKMVMPFIVNNYDKKTVVKDEDGNIIYEPLKGKPTEKTAIFNSGQIPEPYKCVFATYSQFRGKTTTTKMAWLSQVAANNIVIMDESHNASGSSNTGTFLASVLQNTKGVVFLSATFAKRPDNMPIYASKTAIADANMTPEALVGAITNGGVALQEVLSSQLVREGQMIRRERSYEGVSVNYIYLDESQLENERPYLNKSEEHRAIFDRATDIIRDIIYFQKVYVDPIIARLDDEMAGQQLEAVKTAGTNEGGVNNSPAFSGVFNVINQLLFSIKAESVARVVIDRLRQGMSVVVAFGNTMESFLDSYENEKGELVQYGDIITDDFQEVLIRRLKSALRYTVKKPGAFKKKEDGIEHHYIDPMVQNEQFQNAYQKIKNKIDEISVGISISPIDVLTDILEKAGYSVAEVTGRSSKIKPLKKGEARYIKREKISANDAFRKFNDNEVDVLLINRSGSTGASAQAKPTQKVSADKVKPRCMVILQAELDINTEVQKRGRINRTGQMYKPTYDYVISAVPAEQRLMMMLQKKLKSLDANTTSNQKESKKLLDSADFLNKVGDTIVVDYLNENPLINSMIDDPLRLDSEDPKTENAAHRVSGRVAILPIKDQEDFYKEMITRYNAEIELLDSLGENDLEVKTIDLEAEVLETKTVVKGKPGAKSIFGKDTLLEKCKVKNTSKPFTHEELTVIINRQLSGRSADDIADEMIEKLEAFMRTKSNEEQTETILAYEKIQSTITAEKGYKAAKTDAEKSEYIEKRSDEIEVAKDAAIERIRKSYQNRLQMIRDRFSFFTIGKMIGYPASTYRADGSWYKGVVIGFDIKADAKNPYAPSQIRLKLAIGNGIKSVAIPLSKTEILDACIVLDRQINYWERDNALEHWDEIIKESTGDREIRYIVTGNILQGLGNPMLRGRLINYTMAPDKNGVKKVRKGVLLQRGFNPNTGSDGGMRVTVPIVQALKVIKSMVQGRTMTTTDQFGIAKHWDGNYKIIVPVNKKTGGKFYLDENILSLISDGRGFNKAGANMIANLPEERIEKLVDYLWKKFGSSVMLNQNEYIQATGDEKPQVADEEEGEIVEPVIAALSKKPDSNDEDIEDELSKAQRRAAEAEKRAALNDLRRKLQLVAFRQGASPSDF